MNLKDKMHFSRTGFFIGCLLFLVHVVVFDMIIGDPFGSWQSLILVTYLAASIWSFSYLFSILDYTEKPSPVLFRGSMPVLYLFSPFIYIWIIFFSS